MFSPLALGLGMSLAVAATPLAQGQESPNANAAQPNVIVIVSDDAGYADFGFMNGISGETSEIPTPNLDALARRGVRFSRAYVAANCQPTRAAIVTGAYQQRIGNESVGNNHYLASQGFEGIPVEVDTAWDRMRGLGYATGAIGKWHLGQIEDTPSQLGNRPQNQGVDEFYGFWHGSRDYRVGGYTNPDGPQQTRVLREAVRHADGTVTDTVVESQHAGEYLTDVLGDYAVRFIGDHHAADEPFFLYQSFAAPHKPWTNESPDFDDPRLGGLSGARRQVGSMMLTMDDAIGRMVDKLNDPNGDGDTSDSIADDTMIVFVNDNGGVSGGGTDNGALSGVKGSPREGGIRVPMLIAGAGVRPSARGTTYDQPVHGIDLLPTAFGLAGGAFSPDDVIDGVNLLPYINGDAAGTPHDVLVHRWRGTFAVIRGDWKLINVHNLNADPGRYQLHNVADDISEANNLINDPAQADRVAALLRDLTDHEAFFDKPRDAILNRSPESEPLNLFDHFVFQPGVFEAWSGGAVYDGPTLGGGTPNWLAAGTSDAHLMYASDAFAGAVLEFPTHDADYVAQNDMRRKTGMEFMLNRMVLSGDYAGDEHHAATIRGNALLLTNDLQGVAPRIVAGASNAGTGAFGYDIELDLILYHDLELAGEGNAEVRIHGALSDYYTPRGVTKTGASTFILTGASTYTGTTRIDGGVLGLAGDATLAGTSGFIVASGAVLDTAALTSGFVLAGGQTLGGDGSVVGDVTAADGSRIAPGQSAGRLRIDGSLTQDAGSLLAIEIAAASDAGADYDQLVVEGDLLLRGGTLEVTLIDGFSPAPGDRYDLVRFESLRGAFDAVRLPTLPDGLSWDTIGLDGADGTLSVTVIPEPAVAGLLLPLIGAGSRSRGAL